MKGRIIVTDEIAGRGYAALLVDGKLEDLLVDPAEDDPTPRPGAIYWGRVTRKSQNAGGVFADLGGAEGLVREAPGLRPGDMILAQVTSHAEAGKAVPMSARVLYKGRYAILSPTAPGVNVARRIRDGAERDRLAAIAAEALGDDDTGAIIRSASEGVAAEAIAEDIATLTDLRAAAEAAAEAGPCLAVEAPGAIVEAWRDWSDPDPDAVWQDEESREGHFEHFGVWEAIDALRSPRVALPGGGHMYVEATRAMVAVDVNTGKDFSPAACLKANLAAIRELPRQLRLRGFGGQVTVDLAPLAKKERVQLETALRAALKADAVETSFAGWTPLGNLELQRKRERRPITELLA
ncbi:ribonuclease E/G [Oceanicella sp. SM1341]|uniref:ribonuclease E/G n=1 Tax=Oceanicella sp. SM1341 TaxID=1548889 RepID=UPI000E4C4A9A|nr:ribonuclease E/G [Oceanicella sp. SM1341]